jgi:hypothetical protein
MDLQKKRTVKMALLNKLKEDAQKIKEEENHNKNEKIKNDQESENLAERAIDKII